MALLTEELLQKDCSLPVGRDEQWNTLGQRGKTGTPGPEEWRALKIADSICFGGGVFLAGDEGSMFLSYKGRLTWNHLPKVIKRSVEIQPAVFTSYFQAGRTP